MSVGHFISHVGTHNASKTCWRAGCNKTAHLERNARFYCGDHYEPNRAEATDAHVRAAHRLMKPTGGGALAFRCGGPSRPAHQRPRPRPLVLHREG